MKFKFHRWIVPAVIAIATAVAPVAFAASDAEAAVGRALLKKNADSIVGVELVLVTTGGRGRGGGPQETKREVMGTVISSNGLTVVSLFSLDGGMTATARGEAPDMKFNEVKMRMADNSEVPASVVMKDAELDIAFIAPTGDGATKQYSFVDLSNAADPNILSTYFEVGRLGKSLQRVPVVNTVTVIGVIERPRKLILLEDNATLGAPVFDMQQKLLGLGLVYGAAVRAVIVPAADIADMAKQANAARESALPMALPADK